MNRLSEIIKIITFLLLFSAPLVCAYLGYRLKSICTTQSYVADVNCMETTCAVLLRTPNGKGFVITTKEPMVKGQIVWLDDNGNDTCRRK